MDLDVSQITVRRDLIWLESQNLIKCFYGGFKILKSEAIDLKARCIEAIAKYAASFVEDNDVIFINTSSTAISMIPHITSKNVIVITNNGNVINMEFPESVRVYLTGGEIRHPKSSLVGDFALKTVGEMHANKCFMGCSGISDRHGITTMNMNEVAINIKMIENSSESSFVLADHSKFGVVSNFSSYGVDCIKSIITDSNAPIDILDRLFDMGLDIYLADVGKKYLKNSE